MGGVRRTIRRETNFRADFEAWRSGGAPPSDSLEVETNPVSPPIDIFSKSSRSSSRFSSRGRGWRSLLGRRLPGLYPLRYMDRLAGRRPTKMAPSEKRSCFRRGSPSAWVHAGCGSSAPSTFLCALFSFFRLCMVSCGVLKAYGTIRRRGDRTLFLCATSSGTFDVSMRFLVSFPTTIHPRRARCRSSSRLFAFFLLPLSSPPSVRKNLPYPVEDLAEAEGPLPPFPPLRLGFPSGSPRDHPSFCPIKPSLSPPLFPPFPPGGEGRGPRG